MSKAPLLYRQISGELKNQISDGTYRTGERMPGVRAAAARRGVSVATVVAAYRQLEDEGYLQAQDRSGFYVRRRPMRPSLEPRVVMKATPPRLVNCQEMALALLKAASHPDIVQLGTAVPSLEFLPVQAVTAALVRASRTQRKAATNYMMPPGLPELRRQIARRMNEIGGGIRADEVVITTGCQEALGLALRAITKSGDTVAVESPAFYGLLHVMEALGLKALEIPSRPDGGIDLEKLEPALIRWKVKACIAAPNFSNPLGFRMSDDDKRKLVGVLSRHKVPLVEDDVYGDLGFDSRRPATCKGLAPDADILYCSSFSKSLSPGLRVGWIIPGRHQSRVEYMKYVTSIATPSVPQLAVAELLKDGHYARHLREVRGKYASAVSRFRDAVLSHFPSGTRISTPQGGFVIWVELGENADCFEMGRLALEQGISIAPGALFSANGNFKNCFRLSCATVWDNRIEHALATLAKLA